jgi:signal peptidase II
MTVTRMKVGTWIVLAIAVCGTIGCDRVTKHVAATTLAGMPAQSFAAGMVRLEYVENAGGFLSLGDDLPETARTAVFIVATGALLVGLIVAAIRFRWAGWSLLGVALFVAGGLSNWLDRAMRGSVIDFMNVGLGPVRTGVFNVADVAILLGVVMVALVEFRHGRHT